MFQFQCYCRVIGTWLLLSMLSTEAYSNSSAKQASEQLTYIDKFAKVAPERSREAIKQYGHLTKYLDKKAKQQWHMKGAEVGNRLNDLGLMERSLKKLSFLAVEDFSTENSTLKLTLLGHFSLKSYFLIEAQQAYSCFFSKTQAADGKLRGAYMIANSYLSLGDVKAAQSIVLRLYEVAKGLNKTSWFGAIQSTLGIYALHRKDYAVAARYFRDSMVQHQKVNRYSGEFNSALNLLLTFALDNSAKYERLLYRVVRLSVKNGDSDRMELIKLIKVLRKVKSDKYYRVDEAQVNRIMDNIQSSTVSTAAKEFILPYVLSSYQREAKWSKPAPDWIKTILTNQLCFESKATLDDVIRSLETFK